MDNIVEFIEIWKENIKPPSDKQNSHDSLLTIDIDNGQLLIAGLVSWNEKLQQYVFHYIDEMSDQLGTFEVKYGCALFDSDDYLQIREILRDKFGIYATNGIHDSMCPPVLPDKSDFYLESETGTFN